jgi:hypothetical protein
MPEAVRELFDGAMLGRTTYVLPVSTRLAPVVRRTGVCGV